MRYELSFLSLSLFNRSRRGLAPSATVPVRTCMYVRAFVVFLPAANETSVPKPKEEKKKRLVIVLLQY